jgi:hypothetical protein
MCRIVQVIAVWISKQRYDVWDQVISRHGKSYTKAFARWESCISRLQTSWAVKVAIRAGILHIRTR